MAYIRFLPQGVEVCKPEKHNQLWLTYHEWDGLCALKQQIAAFMAGEPNTECRYWILPRDEVRDEKITLRVVLNRYNDTVCYVHLRVYVGEQPTKQGVMLSSAEWLSVQTALGGSDESVMAREVYKHLLTESARSRQPCEGCIHSWGSQRDHTCLDEGALTIENLQDLPPVNVHNFIVELAILARSRGHVLEHPAQCYDVCAKYLHQTLIGELRAGIKDAQE